MKIASSQDDEYLIMQLIKSNFIQIINMKKRWWKLMRSSFFRLNKNNKNKKVYCFHEYYHHHHINDVWIEEIERFALNDKNAFESVVCVLKKI
jgi:hypothetical protein